MCVDCFSVGAYDVEPHQPAHPYRVVERVYESLYAKDWAAHEEERLLHALCDHGPNHWKDIADYVSSKSQIKCERHYQEVFLDGELAPLPTEVVGKDIMPEPLSPTPASEGKKTASGNRDEEGEKRRVKPGVKAGVLEGYMPLRGDFDVEWDDDAENVIADLVIAPNDTTEEFELKIRLLEIYDHRLKRREAVKQILSSHNLLDFGSHKVGGSRTARDEKELAARLKVFSRLLEKNVYSAVQDTLSNIYKLSRDVNRLAQARDAGVHRLSEVEVYDVERKTRVAKLAEASKISGKSIGKRRASGASSTRAAKRTKRCDGLPAPSLSASLGREPVFPGSSVHLEDNLHLVYSPTPEVAGLPPGVNAHDVLAGETIRNPSFNDADVVAGTPLQSKTALLRKAREQRRMMKSTYPQVEAMDVICMPGAMDLTEPELILCSSLRLPPEEFLTLRDAMLCAFNNDMTAATNVASEPVNEQIMTMRATKLRAQTVNDNGRENTQIQVMYKPMTRSVSAAAAKLKEENGKEMVKPSRYSRKHVIHPSAASDQLISQGVQTPTTVCIAHVELEREESRIPAQIVSTKQKANFISSVARTGLNFPFDEESRRHNVDSTIIHTNHPNITQTSHVVNLGKPQDRNNNMCSNTRRRSNTVGLTSRNCLQTYQDVADITAECVGQSGVRLILSIRLPDDDEQALPSAKKRHEVSVSVDVESELANNERTPRPAATTENVDSNMQNVMAPMPRAEELRSLYRSRIARSARTLNEEGATLAGVGTENGRGSQEEDVPAKAQSNRRGEARKRLEKTRHSNGRRTVGARSRGQICSATKTRTDSGGARRTSRRKSAAPAVAAAEREVIVSDDGAIENNDTARNSSLTGTRAKCEAIANHPYSEGNKRPTRCNRALNGQHEITRLPNGIGGEEPYKRLRNENEFDRFAGGVVQEEVLDGGNADSAGRRGVENLLEVEASSTMNTSRSLDGTKSASIPVRDDDKDYLFIAPVGEGSMNTQNNQQSVQFSENEESDVDSKVAERKHNSGQDHYSEPDSPPESASAEDDADPSVDFSLAEDVSEDDDDSVDEKRLEELPRVRRGRRAVADSTPRRVSDRIQKRKRATMAPNSALKPAKGRKQAGTSNVEVEELGPDDAIHVPPSTKKPPLTPVRESLRDNVGTVTEERESATKVPKNSRYSLRRRG